jgi:apolipoprotein N-acyltransferase
MKMTELELRETDAGYGVRALAATLQGLAARMRAVETRRPLVLAVNEGTSMVVDRFGRVAARAAGHESTGWVRGEVGVSSLETPYVRWGDVFVILCGGMVVARAADRDGRLARVVRHVGVRRTGGVQETAATAARLARCWRK